MYLCCIFNVSIFVVVKSADSRVGFKVAVVDGFDQLLRHLYYLLFTSWKTT